MAGEPGAGWVRLTLAETGLQLRVLSRNVVAAFFTLVMPLAFLILFNLFNIGVVTTEGLPASQYLTPAIAVFALVTATFTNLAIGTAIARDAGILKRVYGSPMPLSAHVAGRVMAASLTGLSSVVVMVILGVALYDVDLLWSRLPVFLLIMLLGAVAFSGMGIAVAMLTPSARAAPAVANAVVLPLLFISGIFFPLSAAPEWLQILARLLPLAPFVEAAVAQFIPSLLDGFPLGAVTSLGLWGAAGVILGVRLFRWEPVSAWSPASERG